MTAFYPKPHGPEPRFELKVYWADACNCLHVNTVVLHTPSSVEAFAKREMKWEATVRCVCPALEIDVEGDFVGVSHPQDLFERRKSDAVVENWQL
jgi:hypothetical protein